MNQKQLVTFRYTVLKRVTDYLYRDVLERRKEVINNILRANNMAYDDVECDSFFYDGKKWPTDLGHYRCTFNLHESLHGEMDSFLAWFKPIFETEHPLVETFIRKLVNHSDKLDECIGLFPSALRGVLSTIVTTDGVQFTSMSIEEIAGVVGLSDKYVKALSFRLMANLVGA